MSETPLLRFFVTHGRVGTSLVGAVLRRYAEPARHYHNVDHLARIVAAAGAHRLILTPAQALAVLYHDAIYRAGAPSGDNEQRSADLLRQELVGIAGPDVIDEAARIILDTRDHLPTGASSALVLDLDLLGLAGTPAEVSRDSELVYLENAHLVSGWEDYVTRRARFMSNLLQRPRILHSAALEHYEARLRANLQAVVDAEAARKG